MKKLIEHNADINCLDKQKRTPFIWAASAGATDALRILYKAGADPLHVDKDSLTGKIFIIVKHELKAVLRVKFAPTDRASLS